MGAGKTGLVFICLQDCQFTGKVKNDSDIFIEKGTKKSYTIERFQLINQLAILGQVPINSGVIKLLLLLLPPRSRWQTNIRLKPQLSL